jgi:hypothetical protein
MSRHLSRRRFLIAGGVLTLGGAAGYFLFEYPGHAVPPAGCRGQLKALLQARPDAVAIGQAWLEREGGQFREEAFHAELDATLQARFGECGNNNLEQDLALLIREDFAQERVIDLHGWQLARTEVSLAVLGYLLQAGR